MITCAYAPVNMHILFAFGQPGNRFGTVSQTEETERRWEPASRHADRVPHGGLRNQPGQCHAAPDHLQKSNPSTYVLV